MTVISIAALNLEMMELEVEIYLQQVWRDERCVFRVLPRQEGEITLQVSGLKSDIKMGQHEGLSKT